MDTSVNPSPGYPNRKASSSQEPADCSRADVSILSGLNADLRPRLPEFNHYLLRELARFIDNYISLNFSSPMSALVSSYLLGVARKTLHFDHIFPFESQDPPLIVLNREFSKGQRLIERHPECAQVHFQDIGDCSLILLSLAPTILVRGLQQTQVDSFLLAPAVGKLAYKWAGDACQEKFHEHASTLRLVAERFEDCVDAIGTSVSMLSYEQRTVFRGKFFLAAA